MRAGNITGSTNIPYNTIVDESTGCVKSEAELRKVFEEKGIDLGKSTVHSCGVGVTACIVELAWSISGGAKSAIYDGSWAEYGRFEEPFDRKM